MLRSNQRLPLTVGLLTGLSLLAGCERYYPEPDGEALIRFVKNARLNGKLRVVWPAGMTYLETLMKADAALHAQILEAAGPVNAAIMLWPKDDPRWRDVDTLPPEGTLISDDAPATAPAAPFQGAYDELIAATAALPSGLPESDVTGQPAFSQRVQEALAVDGRPLRDYVDRIANLADLRARLHNRIAQCQQSFDPEATGLTFRDPDCQQATSALYDELDAALTSHRMAFRAFARARLADVLARIDTLDKKRDREEYLLLDNTREYFKRTFESWLKEYKYESLLADDKLTKDQREAEKPPADPTAAYYWRQLEQLEKDRIALKAFATEIGALKPTDHDTE